MYFNIFALSNRSQVQLHKTHGFATGNKCAAQVEVHLVCRTTKEFDIKPARGAARAQTSKSYEILFCIP